MSLKKSWTLCYLICDIDCIATLRGKPNSMLIKNALVSAIFALCGCITPVDSLVNDASPQEINYTGYILEYFKCNLNHAEARFYRVTLQEEKKLMSDKPDNDMVEVVLENRFKVAYWPQKTGVDADDWWCLPRKKYCYSEFPFEQASGTHRQGDKTSIGTSSFINSNNETMLTVMAKKYEGDCESG